MENKFNFNSQICTTKEQSEKLLALGLKSETADCHYEGRKNKECEWEVAVMGGCYYNWDFPAWSLDRLKELYKCVGDTSLWNLDDVNYDRLIQCIGLAIKHNSFNKEYLK